MSELTQSLRKRGRPEHPLMSIVTGLWPEIHSRRGLLDRCHMVDVLAVAQAAEDAALVTWFQSQANGRGQTVLYELGAFGKHLTADLIQQCKTLSDDGMSAGDIAKAVRLVRADLFARIKAT